MRTRTTLIAIALAAAFPLGAYAQTSSQPGQQQRPGASDPTQPAPRGGGATQGGGSTQGAARLDINRDGVISREEAKSSPELSSRFSELDRNRDGALTADELSNASSPSGSGSSGGTSGSSPMRRQQ